MLGENRLIAAPRGPGLEKPPCPQFEQSFACYLKMKLTALKRIGRQTVHAALGELLMQTNAHFLLGFRERRAKGKFPGERHHPVQRMRPLLADQADMAEFVEISRQHGNRQKRCRKKCQPGMTECLSDAVFPAPSRERDSEQQQGEKIEHHRSRQQRERIKHTGKHGAARCRCRK